MIDADSSIWKHAQTLEPIHWMENKDAILDANYRRQIQERSLSLQKLLAKYGPVSGDKLNILEIGGGGTPLIDFFKGGERHEADPLADFYQEQFGRVLDKSVVWHKTKGEKLPFEEGKFDVIISRNVLDHVQDDRQCLLEMHRVLKPGGIGYVAVNNFSGPLLWFRSAFKDPEHPYTYSHSSLDAKIRETSFKILDVFRDPPEHMAHFSQLESSQICRKAIRSFFLGLRCYHYSEWIVSR